MFGNFDELLKKLDELIRAVNANTEAMKARQ